MAVRLDGERAEIEVSDTGCGIREDLLPRVFDRFFRAAPSQTEGTGLGLAICRVIADRHGLGIALRNREPAGLSATVVGRHVGGRAERAPTVQRSSKAGVGAEVWTGPGRPSDSETEPTQL